MKKIGLYLTSVLLSVFLTSCLGGSNISEGVGYGVLDWGGSTGMIPVLKSSYGFFSGSSVMSLFNTGAMEMGGCYAYYYRIDYDQPENSSSIVEANGYQTVTILNYGELSKYSVIPHINDITQVLPDEIPLVKACNGLDYVLGYLFLSHTVNHPEDWKLTWEMSYDYSTLTTPTEENGKRYYELYIRARVESKSDKTSNIQNDYSNVYSMGDFFTLAASNERTLLGTSYSESNSQFNIRFNFVSDLNEETNSITWSSDVVPIYIAGFLTNEYYFN